MTRWKSYSMMNHTSALGKVMMLELLFGAAPMKFIDKWITIIHKCIRSHWILDAFLILSLERMFGDDDIFLINTVLWHVCDLLFFNKIKKLNEHPPREVILYFLLGVAVWVCLVCITEQCHWLEAIYQITGSPLWAHKRFYTITSHMHLHSLGH